MSSESTETQAVSKQMLINLVEQSVLHGPCSLAQIQAATSAFHEQYPTYCKARSPSSLSCDRDPDEMTVGTDTCVCGNKKLCGDNNDVQQFLSRGAEVIIRMRGLPYDCTSAQILEFFKQGEEEGKGLDVLSGEDGVLFVKRMDGKSNGDAFVLLATEEDAQKALAKHKETIGPRYIELFRSTTAEVQQVINQSMEPPKPVVTPTQNTAGLIGALPNMGMPQAQPIIPQQLVISGNRKDCIRLRGLPYEAQVQHILDFLGDYAKHIVFQGVHMVYNAQGHPSGEAFIQMDSEQASSASSVERHNKYMQIGKKQRYIEVFQCSADDMNLVLTGPTAHSPQAIPNNGMYPTVGATPGLPNRPMISPGGGLVPQVAGLGSPTAGVTAPNFQQALLNPQLFGQTTQLQNGNAFINGIPGAMMAGAARVPIIPGLTGLMPAVSSPGGAVVYWPYPSPPVSPSSYYAVAQSQAAVQNQAALLQAAQAPGMVYMRGLPPNATAQDVATFFAGYPEVSQDNVQIQRGANGQPTGEALVSIGTRMDAERAVIEKNRHPLGQRAVELYICN